MRFAIIFILLAGCVSRGQRIEHAVERGVGFLVKSQQPDGSWGTGLETRGLEIYSMVPGSHDAYRVATTALCVMALREAGERPAHDRGVEYLLAHGEARRDQGDMMYNTWAHIFVVQALAIEMGGNSDPRVRKSIEWHLDRLGRYEVFTGGWNYYDFKVGTQLPAGGATSFGTAAGLVALWDARQSGMDVPQPLVQRALRRLRDCRLPNGAYLYGADYQYIPRLPANMPRGSIGRNQPCNYALWLWDFGGVREAQVVAGLEEFFREHMYIEMGRKRPVPHDSWYQTAPYYYYYDHYYAARLLEKLGQAGKDQFAGRLAQAVLSHQEPDGSWWDYAMWDYHKPYGTAFAVMTLLRCR
jgi:hypothetical protein